MSDSLSLPMAAIGSYEMVLPFQAVGVRPFILEADKRDTFERTLDKLARENYAVVFVQEDLFVDFIHKVQEINDAYPTSVLPLPNTLGQIEVDTHFGHRHQYTRRKKNPRRA